MASNTITWLHLSDLHLGMDGKGLWPNVEDKFFEDIDYLVKNETGPIDLVLLTGDIVQSGKDTEFIQAESILKKFWEKFRQMGFQPEFLPVPGNHDLLRPRNKSNFVLKVLLKLWNDEEVQDSFWKDEKADHRKVVKDAFRNYMDWWNRIDHKPESISKGILPGDFSATIEKNNIKLGVLGLNSAFLQLTDNPQIKMAIDVRQFNGACNGHGPDWVKEHHLSLLLTHHPPCWLTSDAEVKQLNGEIHNPPERFALHLFGHLHESTFRALATGGGGPRLRLQGCSFFGMERWGEKKENERKHGYIVGQFNINKESAKLRLWPRIAWTVENGSWEFRQDPSFTYKKGEQGTGPIPVKIMDISEIIPPPPEPLVDDRLYRDWLKKETDAIDITGIGETQAVLSFPMLELYITLHVSDENVKELADQSEFVNRKIPLTDAVHKIPHILIEGDPGSGKSTFLRYLARKYVDDDTQPLPLFLSATDLYNYCQKKHDPDRNKFVDYWMEQSANRGWGFKEKWLKDLIKQGRALVLMDNFDELPNYEARVIIAGILNSVIQEWNNSRWIICSRPGIAKKDDRIKAFKPIKIARLGDAEIDHFVRTWISLVVFKSSHSETPYSPQKEQVANQLIKAIRNRSDIHFLASNPVMLTAISVVHWNQRKLPKGRAQLYETIIEWLLYAKSPNKSSEPCQNKRDCYQFLAFEMFQDKEGRKTEVDIEWAAKKIAPILNKGNLSTDTRSFLEEEELKTGLVIRRGESSVMFWHLSFQEYLAACEIASRPDEEGWALIKNHLEKPEWREVLRFIPIRILTSLGKPRVTGILQQILKSKRNDTLQENARIVGILGDILYDLSEFNYSADEVPEYVAISNQIMKIFTKEGSILSLQERYDAAIALGKGGDPRLRDPEKNWVNIPAGGCWIGAQKDDSQVVHFDKLALNDQQPVHMVFTKSFKIGKYPVTVQEYIIFIEAEGYRNKSFWSSEGWNWRISASITRPDNWNEQIIFPNRPVVGVSWYEAQAYCTWLSCKDVEWNYRLPTEAEWEYVARQRQEYTRYCCGNIAPDDTKAKINSEKSGLVHLTPVGFFPDDVSPDGVMDMNGNVLEWMRNPGPYEYSHDLDLAGYVNELPKIEFYYLRGGSWRNVPCITSHRTLYIPEDRRNYVSVRVLRVPKPIPLKGRLPSKYYSITLADVYSKHQDKKYTFEAKKVLISYSICPRISVKSITRLFPPSVVTENRKFDRLPIVLGKAPFKKLEFNLLYQDTRIKLAVEDKLGPDREFKEYRQDAKDLMEVVSILLNTIWNEEKKLWCELTDNDLDALMYMVLGSYDSSRKKKLLKVGRETNERALQGLVELKGMAQLSIEKLIHYQVFAGTVWWMDIETGLDAQFAKKGSLTINDISMFKSEVLENSCTLIFFFSDNGELVWDLVLIQHLLDVNPNLQITGVINKLVIENDANQFTLKRCLEESIFSKLKDYESNGRFTIFEEAIPRSSVDLSFCSEELIEKLQSHKIAFVKGASAFETIQKLPVDAYYAFVVSSYDSQIYTGLKRGSGVFVRIPAGKEGYQYHKQTLNSMHPQWYNGNEGPEA